MQWWCSATGQPWSGAWQAYPGVWLLVALIAGWYWHRVWVVSPGSRSQTTWFGVGLFSLWVALDWPVGALGAGYLVSVHTVSYILLSLVAPPCLLLAIPRPLALTAATSGRAAPLLRLAARPMAGLTFFTVVLFITHVPEVVDRLMGSQAGAMLVDLAWVTGGLALWWPLLAPDPEVVRFRRPLKMAYLFAATLPAIIPSAFLTFADYPLYATYELAPRVWDRLTAQQDQQVAGLLMKLVGDLPLWFAFGVIFFRWARSEHRRQPPPAHPGAGPG